MSKNNRFTFAIFMLLSVCFSSLISPAAADNLDELLAGTRNMGDFLSSGAGAKYLSDKVAVLSAVSGQPVFVWKSPLGNDDISNTSENRCRIIKTLKPGENLVMQARHNTEGLLSRYATDLYIETIETEFGLDREDPIYEVAHAAEQTLIKRQVLARMASIATRLNIIVSLEARAAAMDSISKLSKVGAHVFKDYEYDSNKGTCAIPTETGNGG